MCFILFTSQWVTCQLSGVCSVRGGEMEVMGAGCGGGGRSLAGELGVGAI